MCLIWIITKLEIILLQFLMGDFLRLSLWSGVVTHCESYVQDIKTVVLKIRVLMLFLKEKTVLPHFVFFSLRIVKSLQLRGRRQIAEPRKYYLVCDYFSLVYIFSLFLHLTDLRISYIFSLIGIKA